MESQEKEATNALKGLEAGAYLGSQPALYPTVLPGGTASTLEKSAHARKLLALIRTEKSGRHGKELAGVAGTEGEGPDGVEQRQKLIDNGSSVFLDLLSRMWSLLNREAVTRFTCSWKNTFSWKKK